MSLDEASTFLSRVAQVPLFVDAHLRDRLVAVYVEDCPIRAVMQGLAEAQHCRWVAGRDGSYRLINGGTAADPKQQEEQDLEDFKKRLDFWHGWAEAGAQGEEDYIANHQEFFIKHGGAWWIGTDGSPGSGQALAQIYFDRPPSEQSLVLHSVPVRLPWRALKPAQRLFVKRMIANWLRESGPHRTAYAPVKNGERKLIKDERSHLDLASFEQCYLTFSSDPDAYGDERAIYMRIYGLRAYLPQNRPSDGPTPIVWEGSFGGQGVLHSIIVPDPYEVASAKALKKATILCQQYPRLRAAMKKVVTFDPRGIRPTPSPFRLLHQRTHLPIITDYHYDNWVNDQAQGPVGFLVDYLCFQSDRQWRVVDGVIVARGNYWEKKNRNDPSLRQVRALRNPKSWSDPLEAWSFLAEAPYWYTIPLLDLIQVNVPPPWKEAWLETPRSKRTRWSMAEADLDCLNLLRLYRTLDPSEKSQARSGRGLPLDTLNLQQKSFLKRIERYNLAPLLGRGRLRIFRPSDDKTLVTFRFAQDTTAWDCSFTCLNADLSNRNGIKTIMPTVEVKRG
jgi:hypothetical protein